MEVKCVVSLPQPPASVGTTKVTPQRDGLSRLQKYGCLAESASERHTELNFLSKGV